MSKILTTCCCNSSQQRRNNLKQSDSPYTTCVCLITIKLLAIAEVLRPRFACIALRGTPVIGIQNAAKSAAMDIELIQLLLVR